MENKNLATRIHNGVQKIYVTDELVKKFDKLLSTTRGKNIVNDISRRSVNEIIDKYQCPYMRKFGSNNKIRTAMVSAIRKHYNIVDYTMIDRHNRVTFEAKRIRTKLENEGKLFKHVKSPQPKIWTGNQSKYQKKPMGLAAYLHALEEHKMDRWNRRHQMPSLEFDLFPELIVAGWKTKMLLARENIRNMLSLRYCHDKRYKPQWRFFGVYKDIKSGHIFEHEPDPSIIGYPGVRLGDDATNAKIVDILDLYKPKAKQSCGKNTICIKVKMYSADGSRWVSRDAA
jgi:hypothetical protein